MIRNNIEGDVKEKCIEHGTTQAQIAKDIYTTKSYLNRIIQESDGVVNKAFVQMMEALGYDIELTYVSREKNKKKKRIGLYIVGSLSVAVGAVIVMPKVIDYLSEKIYTPLETSWEDDDWGPEIIKKEKVEDETSSEEDEINGKL